MVAAISREKRTRADKWRCASVYLTGYKPGERAMASLTVRINDDTHAKLKTICEESGQSMPEVLDRAIELLRRERLLEATNRAFAALRDDPVAWAAEQRERQQWESTLGDGMEGD